MALISCPECNRQVSDKASSCPNCGYPLEEQAAQASEVLAGHRWLVRSKTLGNGRALEADFDPQGGFTGVVFAPPNDYFLKSQGVNGTWHVARSLLVLQWDWMQNSGTYHEEVPMEVSECAQDKLVGVHKWGRLWEFQRHDGR
jgi:hypothetical protein